jgi:hypothetical protein
VDYNQSYVVTSNEYLNILQQKAMNKEIMEKNRKERRKARE